MHKGKITTEQCWQSGICSNIIQKLWKNKWLLEYLTGKPYGKPICPEWPLYHVLESFPNPYMDKQFLGARVFHLFNFTIHFCHT
ncbi:Uncharacterized protein TCM_003891 [Theobroma cacao]|uniref:Uncharacterized protein n=1 Tax=Theobroma cacao TaxID=3641 RepID=A0A061DNB9_THECC|nr:Uncharacterized protein TCM_003891 [Theobroma cacao]